MTSSPYPHSDRDLLHRIGRSAGGKAGYKQLIRELGLGGGRERRLLVEQLTKMVARGDLRQTQNGLWGIPQRDTASPADATLRVTPGAAAGQITSNTRANRPDSREATERRSGRDRLLSGRLELHRDGYGFVRLDASPGGSVEAAGDIFIPPVALHGAMHGDLVLVEEDAPRPDGRRSGRVARVLTRRNPTLVGIFHYAQGAGHRRRDNPADVLPHGDFVQPMDDRMGGPIEVNDADELPIPPSSPHRTLGEDAWRQLGPAGQSGQSGQSDPPNARRPLEGLAVEVEILHYAQPGRPARGRVVEVLGPPDAFGVDVEIIIRKHGIPHTFPAHVLEEAAERSQLSAAALSEPERARREDFRDLPIVTIDGETARDFDDAVLVRALPNGNTELQVHIADVSWYVREGSALDTEARVRGTSVYFPDRAVPMLPHALSSGMCSLLPHEDRLVQSCLMEIDSRGEIVGYRVAEGIIRSARRMTYTAVQNCLNASPAAAGWNEHRPITPAASAEDQLERERIALEQPELPAAFDRMLELALRLNAKRVRRGSIDFDLPEPVVQFDPDGNMKAIVRSERGWAHRLIEEFMLSANECVATWLTARGIPSIYRIHEMPSPKRVMEFEETAAGFGQTLGIGSLPVQRLTMKTDRREAQRQSARGRDGRAAPAHEILASLPVTPQMYQKLVRRIAGKPEERILAYLMLRSLKQARYAEKNEGHFALASPCYTHFTSPIRRYPDLIVHRLLRAMLESGADPRGGPILSDDPQPWAAALKAAARGQDHAAASHPTAPQPARLRQPAPAELQTESRKRPGRIGWSQEEPSSREKRPDFVRAKAMRALVDQPFAFGEAESSEETDGALDSAEPDSAGQVREDAVSAEPISAEELTDIATESSQAERRAAEAERELIEWKKMKFMADKVGDDFTGIVLSVTKFGFFVELDDMFIEGLVPLSSLTGDFYTFRDGDRTICGARSGHRFSAGQRVEVILDRIDRQQRRLQFALKPGTEPTAQAGSLRAGRGKVSTETQREAKKTRSETKGKTKSRAAKARTAEAPIPKAPKSKKPATPKARRKKKH